MTHRQVGFLLIMVSVQRRDQPPIYSFDSESPDPSGDPSIFDFTS